MLPVSIARNIVQSQADFTETSATVSSARVAAMRRVSSLFDPYWPSDSRDDDPVSEASRPHGHVSAGKKYVYAVIALDSRLPFGNISAESNRVEETAR